MTYLIKKVFRQSVIKTAMYQHKLSMADFNNMDTETIINLLHPIHREDYLKTLKIIQDGY